MICEPEILDLIESDETVFEQYPLQTLAKMDNLVLISTMDFGNVWIP